MDWYLLPNVANRQGKPIAIEKLPFIIGRDPTCSLSMQEPSLSRKHASIAQAGRQLQIKDLGSLNGVRVNGAPRQSATIQEGDKIQIGKLTFTLSQIVSQTAAIDFTQLFAGVKSGGATQKLRIELPDEPSQRRLATLYHISYWAAEDFGDEEFIRRSLEILLQGFQADEVQYYDRDQGLVHFRAETPSKKPQAKFAPYLCNQIQAHKDAIYLPAATVRDLQKKLGSFNFLAGPLTDPDTPEDPSPFLLLMRGSDFNEFSPEDRVLLQAVCQTWTRSRRQVKKIDGLRKQNEALKEQAGTGCLIGVSPALNRLRQLASKVAKMKIHVLINGETGSGKEVVAQYIHEASPRKDRPFVAVNCGAIPETLFESELFGHMKGAFTDAKTSRDGSFAQANGGTIFLDEIGEMPLPLQSKVLRVLENGEIQPLGAKASRKVDVRVLAATNRDLKAMSAEGNFREDLYHRLNEIQVTAPPLRDHPEDIPMLTSHFTKRFCEENDMDLIEFDANAMSVLQAHDWPGNVRELRGCIRRCCTLAIGETITKEDVRENL